jgi:hypothetical protein
MVNNRQEAALTNAQSLYDEVLVHHGVPPAEKTPPPETLRTDRTEAALFDMQALLRATDTYYRHLADDMTKSTFE